MKKLFFRSFLVTILGFIFLPFMSIAYSADKKALVTPLIKDEYQIPEKREFPLNPNIDPCDDFQAYVCSIAQNNFKMRPDRNRHAFSFSDSRERLLEKKKVYFKEFSKLKLADERTLQVQRFYNSCMNKSARKASEISELKKLKSELSRIKTVSEFIDFQISNYNTYLSLYSYSSRNNPLDPNVLDIFVGSNLMKLKDHKYYENQELIQDYLKYLEKFIQVIDPKSKTISQRAQKLINFEKDFVKIYPVANVRRKRWSENTSQPFDQVIKKYSVLKLDHFFKNIQWIQDQKIKPAISVPLPEGLDFLAAQFSTVDLQTLKDYFLVLNLEGILDDSEPSLYNQYFEFEKKYFGGPLERPKRDERCVQKTSEAFAKEFENHFIDQVFPNFDEKPVYEVGQKIRESIIKGLKENKWLTSKAKASALKKITDAQLQLVKPRNEKEWDFLPIKNYSKNNFVENLKILRSAQIEKTIDRLSKPANKEAWMIGPLTVNAYYSSGENKFVMPMGILQYPFYIENGDIIENLGAVGVVFAHELGHGIDDNGSKFDSEGKLQQWMTESDLKEFNQRTSRLVDQFNKIDHDGKLTLGENAADLVGVTFAFKAAFSDEVRKNPKETDLENYKKFFTSYARLWCEVVRPDQFKLLRKTDPHSSGVARVNEQVKLQPAFAQAFKCKAGDKMVLPEKDRISVW